MCADHSAVKRGEDSQGGRGNSNRNGGGGEESEILESEMF